MTDDSHKPRPKQVTIGAVARLAGVSQATVSRVLSGVPTVEPDLVRKVLKASEELCYLPSGVARNLRRGRSHTIGLVLSDISNNFFGRIVRGVEDAMIDEGSDVVIFDTDNTVAREAAAIQRILEMRMDGVIVSSASTEGGHFSRLRPAGVPLVVVNREPDHVTDDCVVSDNAGGAEQAVSHLLSLGHRRVGLVSGPHRFSTARSRHLGYENAYHKANLRCDPNLVVVATDSSQESGYRAAAELLKRTPKVTALFVTNNTLAFGVVLYLRDAGVRMPDELAMVMFDDPGWAELIGVSTVVQPVYEMGRTAGRLLADRINGRRDEPVRVVLQPELIMRHSSLAAGAISGHAKPRL